MNEIEAILTILQIMGWLGIVLGILVTVNITSSILYNINTKKEKFCWKKFLRGVLKAIVFYLCAVALSVAFTILPYINTMISDSFGTVLITNESLETLSSTGVLGTVMAAIVTQGKKAISSMIKISTSTSKVEEN